MKAVSVIPLPQYQLQVTFDDDICGVVDLKDLLQTQVFSVLKDEQRINQVIFDQSAIFRSKEMEIDLLNIYLKLSGKRFEELFPKSNYASN